MLCQSLYRNLYFLEFYFHGKITDIGVLSKFYFDAICSVSFGQAGLSVLQSLGFGVPFVTKKNAITGGEINNIINNYNGFLCEDSVESLSSKLVFLSNNIEHSMKMGENAFNYYSENCTIEKMSNGFKLAINSHE